MLEFPNIDPVIISFGELGISWYSLSYVTGIILGWIYCNNIIKNSPNEKVTLKNMDDFISWLVVGIILGGRLGYVIFYEPMRYFAEPIEILKTYKGGMSFHGGVIGVVCACYLFCRVHRVSFWSLIDIIAAATPIALCLGRMGNFINAELYGRVTDMPWGMVFPYSDMLPRHPSQLYEAFLEGVILFIILANLVYKKNALKSPGYVSGSFLLYYGIFRIIAEFFREPDAKIGYILDYFTFGQFMCIPMIIIGIALRHRVTLNNIQNKDYAHRS